MTARRTMRVGIIGAGVMAEAMIAGLLANRAVTPELLAASHPRRERREALAERHGIHPVAANRDALAEAEIVVLAVKPQMLTRVMRELRGRIGAEQVVLSIVAGATLRTLVDGLQHAAVVVHLRPGRQGRASHGGEGVAGGAAHHQARRTVLSPCAAGRGCGSRRCGRS